MRSYECNLKIPAWGWKGEVRRGKEKNADSRRMLRVVETGGIEMSTSKNCKINGNKGDRKQVRDTYPI